MRTESGQGVSAADSKDHGSAAAREHAAAPRQDRALETIPPSGVTRARLNAVAIDLEVCRVEVEATAIRIGMQERVEVEAIDDVGAVDAAKVHAEVHVLHAARVSAYSQQNDRGSCLRY